MITKLIPELPEDKLARFVKEYKITEYAANILVDDKATADYFEQAVKDGGEPKFVANFMINKKEQLPEVPADLVRLIISSQAVVSISAEELDEAIDRAKKKFPKAVEDFKNGKVEAIGVLIGAVLKGRNLEKNTVIRAIKNRL